MKVKMKEGRRKEFLRIADIICDERLYPRDRVAWKTVYQYQNAMIAGSVFPPVSVAKVGAEYKLIDGWHRIEAYKRRKEEYVTAVVTSGLTDDEIYIEAVRANAVNGRQFSMKERAEAILRLQDMKLEPLAISELIRIPVDKMGMFVCDRMVNTITGEPVILKQTLKHLADSDEIESNIEERQKRLSGIEQVQLIDELIYLLSEGLLNLNSEVMVSKLRELYRVLGGVIDGT